MIIEIIEQIKKLKGEGFTTDQAIQIIIANEIKFIGVKLDEHSDKK